MNKVNLSQISEHWSPRIVGELNGQQVKLAKLKGEFVWHLNEKEDEFFYVIEGELTIELRDKNIVLKPGEFFILPEA
jgi:mannose-6-phosphate isomerase-like protein (cupin superfamily)